MRLLGDGCADDLGGGQADALIMDLHAAIARACSDLFGTVGMAIQPRLADQKLQRPPQFGRDRLHRLADRL